LIYIKKPVALGSRLDQATRKMGIACHHVGDGSAIIFISGTKTLEILIESLYSSGHCLDRLQAD